MTNDFSEFSGADALPVLLIWPNNKPGEKIYRYERRWYRDFGSLEGALRHFDKMRAGYRLACNVMERNKIVWC